MTIQTWHKLQQSEAFSGFRRILRTRFTLPDGTEADFEIKQEPHVVSILALTPCGTVLLAKQFPPSADCIAGKSRR